MISARSFSALNIQQASLALVGGAEIPVVKVNAEWDEALSDRADDEGNYSTSTYSCESLKASPSDALNVKLLSPMEGQEKAAPSWKESPRIARKRWWHHSMKRYGRAEYQEIPRKPDKLFLNLVPNRKARLRRDRIAQRDYWIWHIALSDEKSTNAFRMTAVEHFHDL